MWPWFWNVDVKKKYYIMYCIRYHMSDNLGKAFFRPFNALRDTETFSTTYIPPSFFDGLVKNYGINNKILRHKLKFDYRKDNSIPIKFNKKKYHLNEVKLQENKTGAKDTSYYIRHVLTNPDLIIAFESREDAEMMVKTPIYLGQSDFICLASVFYDNIVSNELTMDDFIIEMSEEEFDKLPGVETFEAMPSDRGSLWIGCNRQKNNERMYITIKRNNWKYDE